MDTSRYNKELTESLRTYLIRGGHYNTGALDASISTEVTMSGSKPIIKIEANEYIKYLEDGNVFKSFMNLESTSTTLKNLTREYVLETLFKDNKN